METPKMDRFYYCKGKDRVSAKKFAELADASPSRLLKDDAPQKYGKTCGGHDRQECPGTISVRGARCCGSAPDDYGLAMRAEVFPVRRCKPGAPQIKSLALWSAAVLFILSFEGPPLLRWNERNLLDRIATVAIGQRCGEHALLSN